MARLTHRRGILEIKCDILNVCKKPRRITQILRLANIQYNSLNEFIEPLIKENLITKTNHNPRHPNRYIYTTTPEGVRILKEAKKLATKLRLKWREMEVYA